MRTIVRTALVLAALAATLTACSTTTPPPEQPSPDVTASYYDPPAAVTPPVALAAAMAIISPVPVAIATSGEPSTTVSLIDAGEGWFLGPPAAIDEDGSFTLDFLPADDDLEALLVPADEMLLDVDTTTCDVTVSDPTVEVTAVAFELLAVPGLVVITVDGMAPGILSDEPMTATDTPSLAQRTFYGFVYATGAVEVSATGPGCVAETTTAEVSLEPGWNWVAWTVVLDETDSFSHVHMADVEAPEQAYLTTAVFF